MGASFIQAQRTVASFACAIAISLVFGRAARADAPQPSARKLVSPDARRDLAPPHFSYWAGAERVQDGELALASPRDYDGASLVPPLDDVRRTTTYLTYDVSAVRRQTAWNVAELASLHDLPNGSVLGATFRVDARAQTALQGLATLSLPLPRGWWLIPTLGVGARAPASPDVVGGAELRSDRERALGGSVGVEASRWTDDRARVLGTLAGVVRVTRTVALEERIALGAWTGGGVAGELALRWTTAALQTLDARTALYERVTLSRGPAVPEEAAPAEGSRFATDVVIGARRAFGAYGVALQISEGTQAAAFQRFGAGLTLYGTLIEGK